MSMKVSVCMHYIIQNVLNKLIDLILTTSKNFIILICGGRGKYYMIPNFVFCHRYGADMFKNKQINIH